MNGYPEALLGDVCEITRGTTITKKRSKEGMVPVIAGGLEPAYYHNRANRPANVITVSGSGANAGYVNYFDMPIFASDCSTILPINPDVLDVRYTFYFMKSAQEFIYKNLRRGAAQPHVYPADLEQLRIPLPGLREQRRIVGILDEAAAAIDVVIAQLDTNLAKADELFASYLNSVFTQATEKWTEKKLTAVSVDFGRGRSRHRPRNDARLFGGEYPFIQTGDVRHCDQFITRASQFYSEFGLSQSKLWPKGTVCITIAANIAETGILTFDACFPDSIIGLVVDDGKATPTFVEYLFRHMKAQLQAEGKGSAQDNINLATFEKAVFLFPPLPEQIRLAEGIDAVASEIRDLKGVYQQKRVRLTELREAILQNAFAGEVALSDPERQMVVA